MQILIRAPQSFNCENRWSMMMQKMNDGKNSAQQCSIPLKTPTAMWMCKVPTVVNFKNSSKICFNRCSPCLHMMIRTRNKQEESRISMEKVEKSLREFERFWVWIWNCEVLMQNSVMISALYHLLIQLVKHD